MRSFRNPILSILLITTAALAAEKVDEAVISKIKTEGFQNSQVMEILSYLTDVYGPRLLATPAYREAAEWAASEMTKWGVENVRLENFATDLRGWEALSFSVEMIEPRYTPLLAWPRAWTSGTDGEITGVPVVIASIAELDSLQKYKGTLAGKIVLVGSGAPSTVRFESFTRRFTDDELSTAAQQIEPVPEQTIGFVADRNVVDSMQLWETDKQKRVVVQQFLIEEGVAALISASTFAHGILHVDGTYLAKKDDIKSLPSFVIANEHFSRLLRMLKKGVQPKLKLHLRTQFYENPEYAVNVLAELPGTDRKLAKQLVLIGGHFDSWHAGTGATDNAAGCAVMMEAIRILKMTGLSMRRTVRIGLWGGEEQGYYGSRGYIAKHVGDIQTGEKGAEQELISAYFNFDNGSGKIRGIYLMGNEAVRPVFKALLQPFAYLNANTLTIQNTNFTDHEIFDVLNVPAFQFIQDPLNYMTVTHHTNMDVYDYVIEDDLKQSAVLVAALVYHVANRDAMLPRKGR